MPHIVLTGTESTYKSRLCAALSELFQLPAVPEYARHYMSENGIMASNVNEASVQHHRDGPNRPTTHPWLF